MGRGGPASDKKRRLSTGCTTAISRPWPATRQLLKPGPRTQVRTHRHCQDREHIVDCHPDYHLHEYILALWGMPLGEMLDLEKLAKTCRAKNRWTFFFSSAPANVPGKPFSSFSFVTLQSSWLKLTRGLHRGCELARQRARNLLELRRLVVIRFDAMTLQSIVNALSMKIVHIVLFIPPESTVWKTSLSSDQCSQIERRQPCASGSPPILP